MKKITLLLAIFAISISGYSQSLNEFNELLKKEDTEGQLALINKWEKTGKNDPDFYIAAFNYYVNHGRKEVLSLQQDEPAGQALQVTDSTGVAAFIGSAIVYDEADVKSALKYIDAGIAKFPNRLDMRFGKTYLLGDAEDYENFTKEIITTVNQSNKIKNKWFWSGGKPLDDPKEFMLSSVQSYVYQLYDTGDDSLLENMLQISNTVLKYYPDTVESLSNVSIVYMLRNEPDKALDALLKAEKLSPKDAIVLGNIAHAYIMKKDSQKAIEYYNKVIAHGDADAKQYAEKKIEELKKK